MANESSSPLVICRVDGTDVIRTLEECIALEGIVIGPAGNGLTSTESPSSAEGAQNPAPYGQSGPGADEALG